MTDRYFARDIADTVLRGLATMPVVVITGMRQTGKSTFLQRQPEFSGRRYISLDDFAQLDAARRDPDGFVDTDDQITVDEAQKCPELLVAIKKAVDRNRKPGQFLLSGSSNFSMLKGISESLAGRAVYFVMHPFNRREIRGNTAERPFLRQFMFDQKILTTEGSHTLMPDDIATGGMPSVAIDKVAHKSIWFKGYEQTYLERDVRELSRISNIIAFRQLLHLAALRTGQLLSPSGLSRDAKLSVATTSRYLALLEASFVLYRLSPYLNNRASRLIKSPKLYMSDSGLACHLAGIQNLTYDNPLLGGIFETYVANNLLSIIDSAWTDASLYFWNIQGRHEVDFIIEEGDKCLAVEVKASARWQERDLEGLRSFLTATPTCAAAILAYNGRDTVKLGAKLWAMPLSLALS
jgi:uncharacterized protein